MAYTSSIDLAPKSFTYEQFADAVKDIEEWFTKDICKDIAGNYIFVTTYPFCQMNYFVKETVTDYRAVYGGVKLDFITRIPSFDNYIYLKIREPKKHEFRGKIKFAPKGTLSASMYIIGSEKKGIWVNYRMPILQNESYVINECDGFYADNERNADYVSVMKNAWRFLEQDDRFRAYHKAELRKPPIAGMEDMSYCIQHALCILGDIKELYGAVYEWNGVYFIFPMTRMQMKTVFKDRDKINGRRRWLPTISSAYTRKNGTEVDASLKMGSTYFTINGRTFDILVGAEDFGIILSTKKQIDRMRKKVSGAEIIGDFYAVSHSNQ
jgi:hypothetical protein